MFSVLGQGTEALKSQDIVVLLKLISLQDQELNSTAVIRPGPADFRG